PLAPRHLHGIPHRALAAARHAPRVHRGFGANTRFHLAHLHLYRSRDGARGAPLTVFRGHLRGVALGSRRRIKVMLDKKKLALVAGSVTTLLSSTVFAQEGAAVIGASNQFDVQAAAALGSGLAIA